MVLGHASSHTNDCVVHKVFTKKPCSWNLVSQGLLCTSALARNSASLLVSYSVNVMNNLLFGWFHENRFDYAFTKSIMKVHAIKEY